MYLGGRARKKDVLYHFPCICDYFLRIVSLKWDCCFSILFLMCLNKWEFFCFLEFINQYLASKTYKHISHKCPQVDWIFISLKSIPFHHWKWGHCFYHSHLIFHNFVTWCYQIPYAFLNYSCSSALLLLSNVSINHHFTLTCSSNRKYYFTSNSWTF